MDSQRQIKNLNVETKKNSNTIAKYKDNFAETQKQLQSLKTKLEESNPQKKNNLKPFLTRLNLKDWKRTRI